jgi:hypothetical protein
MDGYPIDEWWGREGEQMQLTDFEFDNGERLTGDAFVLVFQHDLGTGVVYLFFGGPGNSRGKQLSRGEASRLLEELERAGARR